MQVAGSVHRSGSVLNGVQTGSERWFHGRSQFIRLLEHMWALMLHRNHKENGAGEYHNL